MSQRTRNKNAPQSGLADEEAHLTQEDQRAPEPGRLAEKDVAEIVKRHAAEIRNALSKLTVELGA